MAVAEEGGEVAQLLVNVLQIVLVMIVVLKVLVMAVKLIVLVMEVVQLMLVMTVEQILLILKLPFGSGDADRQRKLKEEWKLEAGVISNSRQHNVGGCIARDGFNESRNPTPYQLHRTWQEVVHEDCVSRIIKIMSYNVWGENVQVYERMKAIGQLTQLHSPDIIFLQEVTPSIYKIFQASIWWQTYACSVSPENADRNHFCMLLSRLPARISTLPLKNRTVGKELCVACIDVGQNKKLVAATSHLKSPTRSKMHHSERMTQAEEALSSLNSSPNVVFGGDMNWVENDGSSDGLMLGRS